MSDSINADGIENVTIDGTTATITAAGEYTVEGTLNDGQLIVNSAVKTDIITINLDGVNVTSSTGNAFDGKCGKVTLVPTADESTFTSTSSGDSTTAIYSKNDLTIKGDESVTITKKNNSVTVVSGGDITITKAAEGIQVSETIYDTDGTTVLGYVDGEIDINGGTLDIVSSKDGIQCGTGNVVITDGNITVNSQQDCIHGGFITNISGGTFDLTAYDGAPQTVSANNTATANSCKGIKGGNLVYISGGTFKAIPHN